VDTPDAVASRVDRLYQQAEQATEQFNAAREREGKLRKDLGNLEDEAARIQERVNRMRDDLGTLAGAQYRSDVFDPTLALILSSDPDNYLDRASALDRISSRRLAQLHELEEAQRVLGQKRSEAARKLGEISRTRDTVRARKRTVVDELATAQRLVNSLSGAQRAGLASSLGEQAFRSARPFHVPDLGPSSGRAASAVDAVRTAVGAPYSWGSAGPSSFDCSGLMVWAYQRAGVALPRTSQGQMHAGQQVPLNQIRPGDLVIYHGDASHVGMYVGNGQVVHAPHPGSRVRYDPVGMMPVAAVTRPG
jgi:cell wall-associated NlpC family hydrolase